MFICKVKITDCDDYWVGRSQTRCLDTLSVHQSSRLCQFTEVPVSTVSVPGPEEDVGTCAIWMVFLRRGFAKEFSVPEFASERLAEDRQRSAVLLFLRRANVRRQNKSR